MSEPAPEAEAARGARCLLFADDHKQVRELVREILVDAGYEVLLAADGEEAVAIYRRNRDRIDLVLLDLVMPRLDGHGAFMQLQELDPGVRVLLATGFTEDQASRELLDRGVLGFLQKPYQPGELLAAVLSTFEPPP